MGEHKIKEEAKNKALEQAATDYMALGEVIDGIPDLRDRITVIMQKMGDDDLKVVLRMITLAIAFGRKQERDKEAKVKKENDTKPLIILPSKEIIH